MSEVIKPTRSELLRTRKRIKLARKGHDLLKKKQDSLIIELFKRIKMVKKERETLQVEYSKALERMRYARVLQSDLTIEASAMATSESSPVSVIIQNIAGVKLPQIQKISSKQTVPAWDSITIQDVGTAYIAVVDVALRLAAEETALRKLLIEIEKTKRRAHALEQRLIPMLSSAERHIRFELEEREREEFTRLKMRKK